jgi:Arc/MetJ-type ribon-helix-helix transcriptional regulator
MGGTITFRLDRETSRILRELTRESHGTKSGVIREALRARWQARQAESTPTSWQIFSELYAKLKPRHPALPRHDRARHAKELVREILLAKRRAGTL